MSTWDDAQRIAQARALKASAIAAALRESGCDAVTAARLDDPARQTAEKAAGTRKASPDTWRVVVEMLAHSDRQRALCPFCGLGNPAGEPGHALPAGHPGECRR